MPGITIVNVSCLLVAKIEEGKTDIEAIKCLECHDISCARYSGAKRQNNDNSGEISANQDFIEEATVK